jgi:hypothetical protein
MEADVASAVELAMRVLRVKPGDREEQFAADITGERRQMFITKATGQVVAYGRILELAAEDAGRGLRQATTSAAFWWTQLGEVAVSPLR